MIETILIADGWKKAGSCHCNMTLNLKYTKGAFMVYHMPKRRLFYAKLDGKKLFNPRNEMLIYIFINEEVQNTLSKAPV